MNGVRKTLLAFMAIAITAGALWFTNRSVTPKEATWEDVQNEAEQGGYHIINTEELWKRYSKNPNSLLLVDTRQEWEYRTGHIKGALNFPMEPTWYSRWRKKGNLETFLGTDKDRLHRFLLSGSGMSPKRLGSPCGREAHGYTNVYRDPMVYPKWHENGLPVESAPAGLSGTIKGTGDARCPIRMGHGLDHSRNLCRWYGP